MMRFVKYPQCIIVDTCTLMNDTLANLPDFCKVVVPQVVYNELERISFDEHDSYGSKAVDQAISALIGMEYHLEHSKRGDLQWWSLSGSSGFPDNIINMCEHVSSAVWSELSQADKNILARAWLTCKRSEKTCTEVVLVTRDRALRNAAHELGLQTVYGFDEVEKLHQAAA